MEGNDAGSIDVGFLVRNTVQVDAVTQLGAAELFTFDNTLLHDRPPLLLEGRFLTASGFFPISVLAVHARSLNGIEDPTDGPRVRQKRLEQAQSIAQMVQDIQTTDPAVHLIVTGDFNAFEFSDGYVDVTGIIKGDFNPAENLLNRTDVVTSDLQDLVLSLPAGQRYSFINRGNAQVLDHALVSQALSTRVTGFQYGRGNADAAVDLINDAGTPLRASDHDGLVLFIDTTPAAPPGAHAFTLLAAEDITFNRPGWLQGEVQANEKVDFKKGKDRTYAVNIRAVEKVEISKKNTIDGDVSAPEIENDGDILGAINLAPVAAVALPVIAPFTPGTTEITVEKGQTLSLPPGSYGDITVEKEGTLILGCGTYTAVQIELKKEATLEINCAAAGQETVIHLSEEIELDKKARVIVPNGSPEMLTVNSLYDHRMRFGKGSEFYGTLIAPQAGVELEKRSLLKGAICAREIEVGKDAVVVCHSFSGPLPKIAPDEEEETVAALPQAGHISLKIFNIQGQLVQTLASGPYPAGQHQVVWDATDRSGNRVSSGMYFYLLQAPDFRQVRKMLLIQ